MEGYTLDLCGSNGNKMRIMPGVLYVITWSEMFVRKLLLTNKEKLKDTISPR